jgi:hypothetical protein
VECRTLEAMLTDLGAPVGALVVMDRAGVANEATEANLAWLRENGYRYLVMSREGPRIQPEGAVTLTTAGGETLKVMKEVDTAAGEVRLYCHSPGRERKASGITARFCGRFEAGLAKLAEGLAKPRGEKRPDRLWDRIGRLKAGSHGVGRHYEISLEADAEGAKATALKWEKRPVAGTMLTDPGVYCLRGSEVGWDEDKLWRTYTMLADLEGVFHSLKSELGLRPICHSKVGRSDAHLLISVLAYQAVQVIRRQLQVKGIQENWTTLRETLSVQRRVTASFTRKDGRTLHVRKSTRPEASLQTIYTTLGVDPLPGGTVRSVV